MERGWTHPETGWQVYSGVNMCLFLMEEIFIDNEMADVNQNDAIGVFYDDQCIGWTYYNTATTIIPTIGNDGNNPQFPSDGDEIELYIYDKSDDQILDLQLLSETPHWTNWGSYTIPISYGCTLNIPIQINGNCPDICHADLNNDMIIDILDIISMIEIILSHNQYENISCGDINADNRIDIQDILILIDLIVGNQ
tara:strand:+ start:549 stop:1136 length:588 start_codon:yes stop_codon:yes gene_type:complete